MCLVCLGPLRRCLLPLEAEKSQLRSPEAKEFAERLMTWHRRGFPELGDTGGCGMGRRHRPETLGVGER